MIRLADVVEDIVRGTPFLLFGLQQRLFNLTQIARYVQPHIRVRAKKDVRISAIVMALSRLQRTIGESHRTREQYRIRNIAIHTGLATATFVKSADVQRGVHRFLREVEKHAGFVTLSEGTAEVTLIYENAHRPLLRQSLPQRPKYTHVNLSSLGISFHEKYNDVPGFIYIILQQMMLQHINIVEIASTYTELVLIIDEKDTETGFDTLYELFRPEAERSSKNDRSPSRNSRGILQ